MRITALVLALLLPSCATEHMRILTPQEELWQDAYCHGDLIFPSDQERVSRWAESKRIVCAN